MAARFANNRTHRKKERRKIEHKKRTKKYLCCDIITLWHFQFSPRDLTIAPLSLLPPLYTHSSPAAASRREQHRPHRMRNPFHTVCTFAPLTIGAAARCGASARSNGFFSPLLESCACARCYSSQPTAQRPRQRQR